MTAGTETMQLTLAHALEDLHTRIAASILSLDDDALSWQPVSTMESVHDLIRHAAAAERRWIGEGVANIPVSDEGRFAMIQLSSSQTADHSLFELGAVGQVSQMILSNLAPDDWGQQRHVGGRSVTVADCVLQALLELARVLGHIESTCRLWEMRRTPAA